MKTSPRKGGLLKFITGISLAFGSMFGRKGGKVTPPPKPFQAPDKKMGKVTSRNPFAGMEFNANPLGQSPPKRSRFKNALKRRAARGGRPRKLSRHRQGGFVLEVAFLILALVIGMSIIASGCANRPTTPLYFHDVPEMDQWIQDNVRILKPEHRLPCSETWNY